MHIQLLSCKSCVRLCCTLNALCLFDFKPVLMYCSSVDTREFVRVQLLKNSLLEK